MEPPIQLEPFKLEPQTWRRTLFFYGLWKYLGLQIGFVSLLAILELIVTSQPLATLLLWVYLLSLGILARWSSCRALAIRPLNRELWTSKQVEFDQEIYRVASATGISSQVPFKTFVKVDEFRGFYFLYLSATNYFVLPRTSFLSANHELAFRQALYRINLLNSIERPVK